MSSKDQQTITNSNNLYIKSASKSSYDHVRTLFILRCIEQILHKCSNEFLMAITHNNLTKNNSKSASSSYSVHNEKLLDLILRHLKSIYGNSFYSSSNSTNSIGNDVNFNLNGVTYIEAIILILLFYIRSYYPPSKFTLSTKNGQPDGLMKESASNVSLNTTSSANTSECSTSTSSNTTDTGSENGNTSTLSQSSLNKKIGDLYTMAIEEEDSLGNSKIYTLIIKFFE